MADLERQVAGLQAQVQSLQGEKAQLEKKNAELAELVGPPPASLDALYPPQAQAPLFLLQMFAMAQPMEGFFVDMVQGDMQNALANWEAFKAKYQETSRMAPEWSANFPTAPLEAVDKALQTGDPGQVMGAVGGLMGVCGSCHLENLQKVRAKYHWPDFNNIKLTNPITREEKNWTEFMVDMAVAYSGIGNDLGQGQLDNARQNFQAFSALFDTLRQGCSNCHATERTYFVDKAVQDDIKALGEALASTPPQGEAVGGLLQKIGDVSCGRCHLVHQPAQQLKSLWGFMAGQK